jgi:L-histidine N-alpha-methyltransferase
MKREVVAPAIETAPTALERFAADVRAGLGKDGQKTLPSKYLYDTVGSALFEAICLLPEYGLTRADERLMSRHAGEIVDALPSPIRIAELGSGTGRKTRWILGALARRQEVFYHPIDISAAALAECERELGSLPNVRVIPTHADYLDGMAQVAQRRLPGERFLLLFLGSTIGNFDRPFAVPFLRGLRARLEPGDALLLGSDLVKPIERLLLAYDDPAGVTAAFDKNVLARINRELGGNFDLSRFTHVARWDDAERRVEMHLRADERQRVRIAGANLVITLEPGQTIWTESSHKYTPEEPIEMGRRAGFGAGGQWIDAAWPFAETLLVAE